MHQLHVTWRGGNADLFQIPHRVLALFYYCYCCCYCCYCRISVHVLVCMFCRWSSCSGCMGVALVCCVHRCVDVALLVWVCCVGVLCVVWLCVVWLYVWHFGGGGRCASSQVVSKAATPPHYTHLLAPILYTNNKTYLQGTVESSADVHWLIAAPHGQREVELSNKKWKTKRVKH